MGVIDAFTRACLAIYVARRVRARDALEVFADLMQRHGIPHYIRSDNGPEMVAKKLRRRRVFQPMPITDSGASRSPIPADADH